MASVVVQVFSFGLDRPDDAVERMDELLPVAERDAPPRVLIARASTRLLLADALGVAPASLRISRRCAHCGHPTHGRPVLEGDDRLSFSVSHSGSLGVVALGDGDLLIGIDVEVVRPRVRLDALAARVLDAGSYAEWRDLGSDEQLVSFLRAWTAKEAYLKAVGTGIATRLRDVPTRRDGWTTCAIEVGRAYVATLAVDRSRVEVDRRSGSPALNASAGTGD